MYGEGGVCFGLAKALSRLLSQDCRRVGAERGGAFLTPPSRAQGETKDQGPGHRGLDQGLRLATRCLSNAGGTDRRGGEQRREGREEERGEGREERTGEREEKREEDRGKRGEERGKIGGEERGERGEEREEEEREEERGKRGGGEEERRRGKER